MRIATSSVWLGLMQFALLAYYLIMEHRERHARLFNRIAIPYRWFFASQTRSYAQCFEIGRIALPSPYGKHALDIACGTGAFTSALRAEGWDVEGVDIAKEMIAQAA